MSVLSHGKILQRRTRRKKEMEDNEGPIAASREAALTGGRGHGVIKRTQFGGLCSNCERRWDNSARPALRSSSYQDHPESKQTGRRAPHRAPHTASLSPPHPAPPRLNNKIFIFLLAQECNLPLRPINHGSFNGCVRALQSVYVCEFVVLSGSAGPWIFTSYCFGCRAISTTRLFNNQFIDFLRRMGQPLQPLMRYLDDHSFSARYHSSLLLLTCSIWFYKQSTI